MDHSDKKTAPIDPISSAETPLVLEPPVSDIPQAAINIMSSPTANDPTDHFTTAQLQKLNHIYGSAQQGSLFEDEARTWKNALKRRRVHGGQDGMSSSHMVRGTIYHSQEKHHPSHADWERVIHKTGWKISQVLAWCDPKPNPMDQAARDLNTWFEEMPENRTTLVRFCKLVVARILDHPEPPTSQQEIEKLLAKITPAFGKKAQHLAEEMQMPPEIIKLFKSNPYFVRERVSQAMDLAGGIQENIRNDYSAMERRADHFREEVLRGKDETTASGTLQGR